MLKKLLSTFVISSSVLFGSSFASADFIDDLGDFGLVFVNVGLFLWSLVKFIVFGLKTCLNLIWKAFIYIFSPELFDGVGDVFQNLVAYMGAPAATAFIGLFFIAFLFMFITFIFKLIKGQVSYNTALKKFQKHK